MTLINTPRPAVEVSIDRWSIKSRDQLTFACELHEFYDFIQTYSVVQDTPNSLLYIAFGLEGPTVPGGSKLFFWLAQQQQCVYVQSQFLVADRGHFLPPGEVRAAARLPAAKRRLTVWPICPQKTLEPSNLCRGGPSCLSPQKPFLSGISRSAHICK